MANNISYGEPRYLASGRMVAEGTKRKVLLIAGIAGTVFFGFGMLADLTGNLNPEKSYWTVYLPFLILFVWMICMSVRSGMQIEAARRYETIFAGDRDGFVTIDELVHAMGKDQWAIRKELDRLFRKGFFKNAVLQWNDPAGVILSDARRGDAGTGFIQVKCLCCGGTSRLRIGTAGRCEYCGSPIQGWAE